MNDEKQVIEAEAVPQQAVAIRQEQPIMQPGLFGTTEPAAVITKAAEVATALKDVVMKQGLISNINGKQYPRCEAWTLLGTMLGVFPVLVWTKQVPGGWEARVEARTKDGAIVGAAEAECLKDEKNWSKRDDFAIRSMAQTRATAKCLRMPLGFVMTLSGFEATPAEEMVADHPPTPTKPATMQPVKVAANPFPVSADPQKEVKLKEATATTRAWFIKELGADLEHATQFAIELGWIMPNEILEEMELRFVPTSRKQYESFKECMGIWMKDGNVNNPYLPSKYDGPNIEVPREEVDTPEEKEAWRTFPMPFGKHAGVPLEELEKPYLYGLWRNYTVETEYKGKPKRPETIEKDTLFRSMLDCVGEHYQFKKQD